jgi:hypothetical protein
VEQEWERLLFGELSVKITLNIVNFSLHTSVGCEEEIWVSSIQITKVAGGSGGAIQYDQIKLLLQ